MCLKQLIISEDCQIFIKNVTHLYKGIFWVRDITSIDIISVRIPCYTDGKIINHNNITLNSKRGDNYNHEKTWNTLDRSITHGKNYNYYPRGRVEINKGKAKIFLNPNLTGEEVIDLIKLDFCLYEDNGICDIKVIPDYSEHYRCYLDE